MTAFSSPKLLASLAAYSLLLACSSGADAPPGTSSGMGAGTSTGAGPNGQGGGGNMPGGGGVGAGAGTGAGGTPGTGNVGNFGGVPPTGGTGNTGNVGNVGNAGGVPPIGGAPNVGGRPPFNAGTEPDRNRVAPGTVCGRVAHIQCAGEQHCCYNPGRTIDDCIAVQVAACNAEAYLDAVSGNPITGYNIDVAEGAFTEFENRASQCDPTIAQWSISQQGLRGVTQGTVPAGGDCSTGGSTDPANAAAHLASCTDGANQACLPGGATGIIWECSPRGGENASCFTDLNCIDGYYCDNFSDPPTLPTIVNSPKCHARKPDGSPCAFPLECASLTCIGGACVAPTDQTAYCL